MGHSPNIYSILSDHQNQSPYYADLQLPSGGVSSPRGPPPSTKPKPSLGPPSLGPPSTSTLHHATLANLYQPIGLPPATAASRTLHYPSSSSHQLTQPHTHSSSSNSSTPPSLSTSSTTNSVNHNGNHHGLSNGHATLASNYAHHTYDRPDAVKQQQQQSSYFARLSSSFGPSSGLEDSLRGAPTSHTARTLSAAGRSSLYHPNANEGGGGVIGHCEYAILRFDEPPSPPSQC